MKKLLLGIIAINLTFISLDTNAFEFKGVKSGMSESEIIAVTGFSSAVSFASSSEIEKWMGDSLNPLKIEAKYIYPDRQSLYELKIIFEVDYKYDIYFSAKHDALDEVCDSLTDDMFNKLGWIWTCTFTDTTDFDDAVLIEKAKYLETLK